MIPKFTLRKLTPSTEDGRERTRKALEQWKSSQERLEKICAAKGIPVPVMVC